MPVPLRQIIMIGAVMVTAACLCGGLGARPTPTSISTNPPSAPINATPTPSPTLTPEVIEPTATLTWRERDLLAEHMIKTNGGCELPCFFGGGVTLGETSVDDVSAWMYANGIGGGIFPETPSEEAYEVELDFSEENGVVLGYKLYTRWLGGNPSRFVSVMAERYSWYHLLTLHGEPSSVLVDSYVTVHGDVNYRLMLVYEALGFYVEYSGNTTAIDDQTIEFCPRFEEVEWILLEVINPRFESISQTLEVNAFADSSDTWLLEATGMSVNEFTQEFKDPDSDTCLQMNAPK